MRQAKIVIVFGLLLIFLGNAGAVMAERETGTYTLTPFIGGYVFDSDQGLKDKPVYGAGFGFTLDKTWDLEGVFTYIDTESETGAGDVKGYQYRIDGLYHFMPSGKLLPYLGAGIGGITLDPDRGGSDTDPLINYGAGVKYFLKENMALRGDVRHIISFGSVHHNLCYTIGLSIFFGGEKKKIVEPPADTDKDGVYDYLDKCPNTPAGVKVDTKGCPLDSDGDGVYDYQDQCPDTPAGVKVDTKGCPLDSDGDGVYDYQDQCPDTPAGVKVDTKGCPLDSDGDGVYDYQDQCPDTPAGVKVDAQGCPLDSDGDGVYDYQDQCPDTPAGVKVDAQGCPLDSDGDGVYDYQDQCPDTPAGVKVDAQGCPLDSDGDGVYDYQDQCPDTPAGVKVDAQGCPLDSDGDGVYDYLDKCPDTPAGVKVDAQGCPLDSDGDGVYDYLDKCPDTPAGVKVDTKGCPLDSDGDGVPDYLDQCPRTPAGATVNEVGCWVCKGLEFDFDKWNIKPRYYPILDEAADCMNQHPYLKVEIQGHTDNIGTQEYNQKLSEKRAGEVMNYFLKKGISQERLSTMGYGFSKPIASNDTPEGRAMNRRVQLKPIY